MHTNFILSLQEKALAGHDISLENACSLLNLPDEAVFDILASSERVRRHYKGSKINLCSIVNAKSGLCQEDCSFCSQSAFYPTDIKSYPLIAPEEIIRAAVDAEMSGVREFSIVTSGTGLDNEQEIKTMIDALTGMRDAASIERCASLGIINKDILSRLKGAGLNNYHHNLETSRSFFPNICTTHDYEDDINTIREAKRLGFYVCSGGVFGLGESRMQRIELAVLLKELDVDSIPINFLNPRPGTPLANANNLTPVECLKIIALFRFMLPTKDIVICGGRQVNLRDLQCLIFAAGANGVMVGNYLTTSGRPLADDLQMLKDMGLEPNN